MINSAIVNEVTTKVQAILIVLKIDYGSLCNYKEIPELHTERKIACYYLSKTLTHYHIGKILKLDYWTVYKYVECMKDAIAEDDNFNKIFDRIEEKYGKLQI